MGLETGDRISLEITKLVHGGLGLGRHEGQVVFCAGTLPGEVAEVRIRDMKRSHAFADLERLVTASPHRVLHIWPEAEWTTSAPERPGGADFGHIEISHQRERKTEILRESLSRFGRVDRALTDQVSVEAVPGDLDGLHWRTRVNLHVDSAGRAGPYAEGSNRVIPVQSLPLATVELDALEAHLMDWSGHQRIRLVHPAIGEPRVIIDQQAPQSIVEVVEGKEFHLSDQSFWQVHRFAPQALQAAVTAALQKHPWDRSSTHFDLYAGVGLFSTSLLQASGGEGSVLAVESDSQGAADLAVNLRESDNTRAIQADVTRFLRDRVSEGRERPGALVMDPPRQGAKSEVVTLVSTLRPDLVVYVACDPVALGRDVGLFSEHGYELASVEGLDLFPQTHHMEAVAVLLPQ